jgi:hypothetical protein
MAYRDDAQVCDLRIEKYVAAGDEQPHTVVLVTSLDNGNRPVSV